MGIQVHYEDMPGRIKGFAKKNNDGSFTIVINSRHSAEQQKIIYEHEVRHIKNGDFDNRDIKFADIIEYCNHIQDRKNTRYEISDA